MKHLKEFNESNESDKLRAISFLQYELVRLGNRKPSVENEEDRKSILRTLDYLESNRDILN